MFNKGLVLVIIPLISQSVFLGILWKIRIDQAEAQNLAQHTTQVISLADNLFTSLAEMHGAVRGHLLVDSPEFAKRYEQTRSNTLETLQALERLIEDKPEQLQQVQVIEAKAKTLIDWLDGLHELIRAQQRDDALALVQTQLGQTLVDDVRQALQTFLEEEQRLQSERLQDLDEQAQIQNFVLVGGIVLAIATTALLSLIFARTIGQRLNVLTENTRRMAEGKELLPPLGGDDELTQLDDAFRDMAAALAQKNQENEMFVYSVSHDLRSPLVNLQGFSQELAASCQDLRRLLSEADLPEATRKEAVMLTDLNMGESIRFIQNAVMRLSGIIDALLRLSRAGRVEYRWQSVDVQATVRRVVEALQNTTEQRGAEMIVHELRPAWGDPTAVEQIFANLIGNALNYLDPQRPGRIEVGMAETEAEQETNQHTYYVKDNGLGIPEAHLPKVFIAFQRLHPDVAKGEGIGLALVRRIVERHGGRLWLESAAGVGTTFYVALPIPAETESPAPVAVLAGRS